MINIRGGDCKRLERHDKRSRVSKGAVRGSAENGHGIVELVDDGDV